MEKQIFNIRVKELRKEANLTQTALAEAIGAKRHIIDDAERGRGYTNPEYTLRLADYFKVSLDYLYGRTDNRKGIYFYSGEEAISLEQAM